jgi:hypothetical protein
VREESTYDEEEGLAAYLRGDATISVAAEIVKALREKLERERSQL